MDKIKQRDIFLSVILTIFTCGIYALYWQYKITNEIHTISKNPKTANGGRAVLYTILSLSIYFYYWIYQISTEISETREFYNLKPDSVSNKTYMFVTITITLINIAWAGIYYCVNFFALALDKSEIQSDDEMFAVGAMLFIFLISNILFNLFIATILVFYIYHRKTEKPATLYVLLGLFKTHILTIAFLQSVLNDFLLTFSKEQRG